MNEVIVIVNELPDVSRAPDCSDKGMEFMMLMFLVTDLAQAAKADIEGFVMLITMSLKR